VVKLVQNLRALLLTMDLTAFVTITTTVIVVVHAALTRNRLLIATSLIATCYLGILLTYYEPWIWAFNKQTAVLMPLFIGAIVASSVDTLKVAMMAMVLTAFPYNLAHAAELIRAHRHAFLEYTVGHVAQVEAFDRVRALVAPNRENIVLWLYSEH